MGKGRNGRYFIDDDVFGLKRVLDVKVSFFDQWSNRRYRFKNIPEGIGRELNRLHLVTHEVFHLVRRLKDFFRFNGNGFDQRLDLFRSNFRLLRQFSNLSGDDSETCPCLPGSGRLNRGI
ncbi:hypothetical protein D3C81_937500 [compost metagenome]